MTSLSLSLSKMLCHFLYTCAAVQFERYGLCLNLYTKEIFQTKRYGVVGRLRVSMMTCVRETLVIAMMIYTVTCSFFYFTLINVKKRKTHLFRYVELLRKVILFILILKVNSKR